MAFMAQSFPPSKQADLVEFAHAGQEDKANVGVVALDHRVKIAQPVAHGDANVQRGQMVQNQLQKIAAGGQAPQTTRPPKGLMTEFSKHQSPPRTGQT